MSTTRALARTSLGLAVVLAAGLATSFGASAQTVPDPTSTTTTTAPPRTTTTTAAPSSGAKTTTTTTAPPAAEGSDAGVPHVIPPGYAEIINAVKRSKPNDTTKLIAALQPLVDQGMKPTDAFILGFGRFPVAGPTNFTDDWLNARFTPVFHLHQGTDLFAAMGTPLRAAVEGVLRRGDEAVGGLTVYITTPEGHEVYMAHMAGYSDVKTGQTVKVGDVVGFVGDTGDAKGGAPHCHFEIHPKGRGAVDPKAYLDLWLTQALEAAPAVVAQYGPKPPPTVVAPAPSASDATPAPDLATSVGAPRVQLAWASSANPTGGALRLAEVDAATASAHVDWEQRARAAAAQRQRGQNADAAASRLARPLTPLALRDVLGLR